MYTIYKHTCPNGKSYIGQTKLSVDKRWLNGNGYKRQAFYSAIEKYGWDNIQHEILEDNIENQEDANDREIFYIHKYNSVSPNGYNISLGGGNAGDLLISRVGEVAYNNSGQKMEIVAYRGYSDIDVKIDNKIIEHTSYGHFKEGKIGSVNDKAKIKYIGQYCFTKDGVRAEITDYINYYDIEITFSNNKKLQHVRYDRFKRLVNIDTKYINDDERVGRAIIAKNGMCATIINYRGSENIDIQFEDGTIVKGITYDRFLKGWIKHPNIKVGKIDRTGERVLQNCGIYATIIKYNTTDDIDLEFSNGDKLYNKRYRAFRDGYYRSPSYQKIVEDLCNKYCISQQLFYKTKLMNLLDNDEDIIKIILQNDIYSYTKYICKKLNINAESVRRHIKNTGCTHIEAIEKIVEYKNIHKYKCKIDMYTIEGVYIRTLDSLSDAERIINKAHAASAIRKVLNGERKSAYGYKWVIHGEKLEIKDEKDEKHNKAYNNYNIYVYNKNGEYTIVHSSIELAELYKSKLSAVQTAISRVKKVGTMQYKNYVISIKELTPNELKKSWR